MAVLRRDFDVLAQKIEDGNQVQGRGGNDNLCDRIWISRRDRGVKSTLTGLRIEGGVIERFDQRPLRFAGRRVHLEITTNEKLAGHGC